MKELTLIALSLVGCCTAYLIKVPTTNTPTQPRIAPLGWVHIQKLLLPLFDNVCEESMNVAVVQLAKEFTFDKSNGDYLKSDVIENLRNIRTAKGFLPKGEIFTEYNTDHINELRALYEVFFYARDFDTFYRAAAWARQNVNCGLFVDAIYLAIVNRKDTARVSVPAPYELLPNYFINKDVIVRASFLLTADSLTPTSEADVRVEGNSYILDTNYTTDIDDGDEDSKLAYFREDIGLNAYYFIRKLRNAPWFNTPNDKSNFYGEHIFMMMKQFAARYDLERYSQGLPELEGFDWESTIAYDPMLIYSNGNEFDRRTMSAALSDDENISFLKTIENNIVTVVNHLRQAGHNKAQILNHLMEILVTSDKSYETLCRKLLGYDKGLTERHYSVLEHYMTTMRDPLFWKINKKIVQIVNNAFESLPSYSRNELYFPGVEILNVETKKMMTTFDNFQFDVTDSLKSSTTNTTFQVKISQPRLNHKPFTIKLNISSLVTKKGLLKIFLGPKMMPGELALKKHLFVLLDQLELNLKRGYNVISRSSEEMSSFSNDFISIRALRKKVEDAEFGLDALPLKNIESQIGYPNRLILPKGLSDGLPVQIFVFVAPLTKGTLSGASTIANMEINSAAFSPGYPLDLPIEIRQLFGLPNSLVREITVTHKSEVAKPNGGRPGGGGKPGVGGRPGSDNYNFDQGYNVFEDDFTVGGGKFNKDIENNYEIDDFYDDSLLVHGLLGDRPDFTYRKTDTTNYAGNKNQYRKKENYASKRTEKSEDISHFATGNNNYIYKATPGTVTDDVYANTLPVHGLLGDRPDFTYRKDSTDRMGKNTQYKKKEDYAYQKNIDQTKTTKNTFNTIENIVEDDNSYVDTLVPHGLLGAPELNIGNDIKDRDYTGKKYQYIKKGEERTAQREQKKDKYTTRGEQKKEEYVAKREKKKDENIAKKEKYLSKDKSEERLYDEIDNKMNNYETNDKSYEMTQSDIPSAVRDHNTIIFDRNGELHHGLLSKSDMTNNIETGFKTKTYQLKKKKEEYDPTKTQIKKVDYRENVAVKGDKTTTDLFKRKKIHTLKDDSQEKNNVLSEENLHEFVINNSKYESSKGKKNVVNTEKNRTQEGDKNTEFDKIINYDSTTMQQNINGGIADKTYFENNRVYTNKDIVKNIDIFKPTNRNVDDKSTITDDDFILDTKTVHKNIIDKKLNKDIQVDKTKKDITKKVSKQDIDDSVSNNSKEESEELNSFTIYEPIVTTEKPKKRITVYDFLFNPVDYSNEELKVYI